MSAANPILQANRRKLLLVALVFLAPLVGAYALFFLWHPSRFTNYGELIAPVSVGAITLSTDHGQPFALAGLRRRWVLLTVDSGACDELCRRKLWVMRQVRLAQGKEMDRLERAWLLTDAVRPEAALASYHAGLVFLRDPAEQLTGLLPAKGLRRDHIYLIDPLGNVMMRYDRDVDPSRMKKDIEKLLRVSQVG